MKSARNTALTFYKEFYGHKFVRHFRAPSDLKNSRIRNTGNQVIVDDSKKLWLQVHKRSGLWPCYTHVYDFGLIGNLNRQNSDQMIFDRVFFDFDIDNKQAHEIKKELVNLRSHGLNYKPHQQDKLRQKLRELIIEEHIAEPAINEAKDFAIRFKESFGACPILFFSGFKGCHGYSFFKPITNLNINRTLYWFGNKIKKTYNYKTLDLSVLKDAKTRLSRVPYSKHHLTLLTVVPFCNHDSHQKIIEKAINPVVEPFNLEKHFSSFGKHLKTIDPILEQEEIIKKNKKLNEKNKWNNKSKQSFSSIKDHRIFFKELLGDPVREYPDKEYVMYCCPFPDHDDYKPSFKVHKTNYECYGCGRKGNLARVKDYSQFKKFMSWI